MHNLCSESNFTIFSGTAVERDFVEMPSQMLENWIWDEDILKRLSKHHKTGEQLSNETIAYILDQRNFMSATKMLQQVFLGTVDFLLYSASDIKMAKQKKNSLIEKIRSEVKFKEKFLPDTDDLYRKSMKYIKGIDVMEGTNTLG